MFKKSKSWKQITAVFLTSQMISIFGSTVVAYAVIWYITLETSSSKVMAVSILCAFLPQIVISPIAGVWADRYSRKILIIISDICIATVTFIAAVIFIGGSKSLTLLFAASALRSVGAGIQTPAENAVLPQIVPVDKLARVNGINSALNSAMMLASPAVGGLLLGTIGFARTLLVDVFTALIAVVILWFLKIERHELKSVPGSAFSDLKNGLQYVKNHVLIRRLLIFYALFFFLIAPAAFLTPIMINRSFGSDIWRLTINEIFWTSGSLIGGIIIAFWGGFKNRIHMMALSTLGFGVTFTLLGLAGNFWVFLIIMLISGIFMPVFSTAETVLIQENVEQHMLGRVFSIVQIIVSAAMPLGMVVFGPIGDIVPIEYILIGTGISVLIMTPVVLKKSTFGTIKPPS